MALLPAQRGRPDAGPGARLCALRPGRASVCHQQISGGDAAAVRGAGWAAGRGGVRRWRVQHRRHQPVPLGRLPRLGRGVTGRAAASAAVVRCYRREAGGAAGPRMSVPPQNARLSTSQALRAHLLGCVPDNPKPIAKLLEEADAIRDTVGSTTLDKASTKRS